MSPGATTSPSGPSATAPAQYTSLPPGGTVTTFAYGPTGAGIPSGLIDRFLTRSSGRVAGQRARRPRGRPELRWLEEQFLAHRVDLEWRKSPRALVALGQPGAQPVGLLAIDPVVEGVLVDDLDRHAVYVACLLDREQLVDHVLKHRLWPALPGQSVATAAVGGEVNAVALLQHRLGGEHAEILLLG